MILNDNRKLYKEVYDMLPNRTEIVTIPALQYIIHRGSATLNEIGRPINCWAIWKIVNQLKRLTKNNLGYVFKLMPHEIEWHEQDGDRWTYTELMQVPDLIDYSLYEEARANVEKRYKNEIVPETKFVAMPQRLCVQRLHMGPYRETGRTVERIVEDIREQGYRVNGDRYEIYVNPPECQPTPNQWKTIVRMPVSALDTDYVMDSSSDL